MEHLRGALGDGARRGGVRALARARGRAARRQGHRARRPAGRHACGAADDAAPSSIAEHGSPLWLVDLDRVRARLREFRATWTRAWPDTEVAYSYKTNRLPAILRALADEGAGHEVVCEAEYALARDAIGAAGPDVIVNGPAKPDALLERAASRRRPGRRRLRARARARGARPASSASACASRCPASASSPRASASRPRLVARGGRARPRARPRRSRR